MNDDFRKAHAMAVLAILQATEGAMPLLTDEQREEFDRRIADGSGRIALHVSNDGHEVRVYLALVEPECEPFSAAMLRLTGPVTGPAADPKKVTIVNLNTLN